MKKNKNNENANDTPPQKWYQLLWIKLIGALSLIALIAAILSDGGQVWDRFKPVPVNEQATTSIPENQIVTGNNEQSTKPARISNFADKNFNAKAVLDSLEFADAEYLEFNHNEYAYRCYERIYNRLPTELKNIVDNNEIKKAKDKIKARKDREAAGIMKIQLDKVKRELIN